MTVGRETSLFFGRCGNPVLKLIAETQSCRRTSPILPDVENGPNVPVELETAPTMWLLLPLLISFYLRTISADPTTHPIHPHWPRSFGTNGNNGLGITPLSLSSDEQFVSLFSPKTKKATPSFRSYYTLIAVGGINFRVALDTASSDLWILSSECETKACRSVPRYPRSYQSLTYATVGNGSVPFAASYADGTGMLAFFLGALARDKVWF